MALHTEVVHCRIIAAVRKHAAPQVGARSYSQFAWVLAAGFDFAPLQLSCLVTEILVSSQAAPQLTLPGWNARGHPAIAGVRSSTAVKSKVPCVACRSCFAIRMTRFGGFLKSGPKFGNAGISSDSAAHRNPVRIRWISIPTFVAPHVDGNAFRSSEKSVARNTVTRTLRPK